ncbi:MAG: type II toxin-antitoxin system MqsA family antitoxin [Lamprobacter sp.]|uniref:type II toxin-antitoxin system MqsA family antitoxin n=1 Tax=Lamprobacter sp. TaxID=3100796 RepID=UPI002B263A10|nr:type II toxin-antitoxin system MqsA family antitoxin [Lamprobacter sp.]MEA3639299.1 type II toxin-antitoxin system MqsA family antitoxin [Lamprobacter sp.]
MKPACPICSGHREPGRTTFTAELGFGVVVVRHVPALVCDQCGEEWIEDPVAAALEAVVEEVRAKQSLVEVTDWRERAV